MDMQMPVMDGLEATRRIHAMQRHASTPIVAMTANAFGEDRTACLEAGMLGHVAKPVDPAELYSALLRWMPAGAPGSVKPANAEVHLPHQELRPVTGAAGSCGFDAEPLPERLDDDALAHARLDALEALLEAGDYEAGTAFRQIDAPLRSQFGHSVAELEAALRDFDYERALTALRKMRSQVGSTR
jgi:CheY-like chemotaxis protein